MQHRAYQPILPCGNKYLQQKWDRTNYEMHKKKVTSAKPTVSTGPPQTYGHLQLKMKKLKLEEERMYIINRDNDILLDKMSSIMRTTGRIGNKNHYENKSLNREKRQQELIRVTKENQLIVERLSRCGPKYSSQQWHDDWQRTEGYMGTSRAILAAQARLSQNPLKKLGRTAKERNPARRGAAARVTVHPVTETNVVKKQTDKWKGSDGERNAETKNAAIKDSTERDKIIQE
ncbi:hypothetical protein SKAU_G00250650 [Synaphobranchus kaupii]|uniref:Cilia- and flagella-associated protein 97 n=1 Tax=Synaphobranchus kaupii TaxID=118154 RepID=A0A9Q1F2S3_SYNKA|nr:hypothetical protein SKAU_G00250650 [Synaphobranchus kaupii]